MTQTTNQSALALIRTPKLIDHSHLLLRPRVGPLDGVSKEEALALVAALPHPNAAKKLRAGTVRGASWILDWLLLQPGDGWQGRWLAADADRDLTWVDTIGPAHDRRTVRGRRQESIRGLACLLLLGVVLPDYRFLTAYRSGGLFGRVRQLRRPDLFALIEQAAEDRGLTELHRGAAIAVISKMVLRTGSDVDQLTADDVLELFAWCIQRRGQAMIGLHGAWDLLGTIGVTPAGTTLRGALLRGPRSTADLVDDYALRCRPIRDVLVRYLDECRPTLDYGSLRDIAAILAGRFWADLEHHHPGIDSLHLPEDVAQAWKSRMQVVTDADGRVRPRKDVLRMLSGVRALYLDLQQWALDDPSWAPWVAPSPVGKRDMIGYNKMKRVRAARMHQRVRERLPHLQLLSDIADKRRIARAALLAAATDRSPGETFEHDGVRYRRHGAPPQSPRSRAEVGVVVTDLTSGTALHLSRREDEAFWGWAIIETLRHTGVRIEELLEITHLALVSYRLPDTGELVPLLQITPSKTDRERLILVSPELASVLATIITRLRHENGGTVPLTGRFDPYERVVGPRLPHLFQRFRGGRAQVITDSAARKLINVVVAATGLRDAANEPLRCTPHDFRRMFATEVVSGGLPVHIAARLLGHESLETTQAYLAVFQDDLVRSYRAFLHQRRAIRPTEEYRAPTDAEWTEFQQHFHARKLELGTCGRPYGNPCQHEHACIRCPMLRVDPRQQSRLIEIVRNLAERIAEARLNGWLGEVRGLEVSLEAARAKLAGLTKSHSPADRIVTDLGIPTISTPH